MLEIRSEEAGDEAAVRALTQAAFGRGDEATLVDRLRADGACVLSLVAAEDDALVGHVLFSLMEASFRALGLGPVSVAPARQRKGIGSALVRAGLEAARGADWDAVFVVGDPAYYRRFGFTPEAAAPFGCAYAGPHLMALPLVRPLPAQAGEVAYAPAFAALD